VFVLLDNDGEADAKRKLLNERGLDDRRSHVWREKELESYLLIPSALSSISGKPIEEVEETINATAGSGKQKLEANPVTGAERPPATPRWRRPVVTYSWPVRPSMRRPPGWRNGLDFLPNFLSI
jgi:hypothetical protein